MSPAVTASCQSSGGPETWHEAVTAGDIDVAGPPRLARSLPTWFTWSPWADVTRQRSTQGPHLSPVPSRPGVAS